MKRRKYGILAAALLVDHMAVMTPSPRHAVAEDDFRADLFEYDLSQYGALATTGRDVRRGGETSLDEVHRPASRVESNMFAEGIQRAIGIGHIKEDEAVACSTGSYPCRVGARLLSKLVDGKVKPQRPPPQDEVTPDAACSDFVTEGYARSSWTLDECRGVWEKFALSVPPNMRRRFEYVDLWKDTGRELRQLGSPCLVATTPIELGVGSQAIRHLFGWIYAEQMGCDWATPMWGTGQDLGNGSVLYCHTVSNDEQLKTEEDHCSVANWNSYFQFDVPSVVMPQNVTLKNVQVCTRRR